MLIVCFLIIVGYYCVTPRLGEQLTSMATCCLWKTILCLWYVVIELCTSRTTPICCTPISIVIFSSICICIPFPLAGAKIVCCTERPCVLSPVSFPGIRTWRTGRPYPVVINMGLCCYSTRKCCHFRRTLCSCCTRFDAAHAAYRTTSCSLFTH